jgi:predicted amidophosphoribosyltransferase
LPDLLKATHYRPSWNKTRETRFLSLRKWNTATKGDQVKALKQAKESCDEALINPMAQEFEVALGQTFKRRLNLPLVFTAPPSSGQHGRHLASEIARKLGNSHGRYVRAFRDRTRKIKRKSSHYGDRTEPELIEKPSGICVLVDDVATTGTTIEQCTEALSRSSLVIPIVWIYGDLTGEPCDTE